MRNRSMRTSIRRYNAAVEGVGPSGGFLVLFDGYGTQEEVGKDAIQLRVAEEEEGSYKGACAAGMHVCQ